MTVIVPTKDSGRTIDACLKAIQAQSRVGEIIVVDNGSTDNTRQLAAAHGCRVVTKGPERSAQRNEGANQARDKWVLFIDSDMQLESGAIEACVNACEDADAAAAILPEQVIGSGLWGKARELEKRCYVGDPDIESARFFDRKTFSTLGGYDEELIAGEDWDLQARLARSRTQVIRSPLGVVHLEDGLTLRGTFGKKKYYGLSIGRYASKHPELAKRQLNPLRRAYLRNWRLLVRHPLISAGLVVLKAVELAGLVAGRLEAARKRSH